MTKVPHTGYAEKFERLLELFPHPHRAGDPAPDRRKWRMAEITEATGGELSAGYLSALRRGRNKRPGMDYLDRIASVMGFPFELWLAEPEQWSRVMTDQEARIVPPAEGTENEAGEDSYADLLEELFSSITNRRTGKPFTNREIAQRSGEVLDEERIHKMREGEFTRPSREELIGLSNAFGVEVSYWFGSRGSSPLLDETIQDVLQGVRNDERRYEVLKKSFGWSDDNIDFLLELMDRWEAGKGDRREGR